MPVSEYAAYCDVLDGTRKGRFDLVFHGISGAELRDIHEAVDYGVVNMTKRRGELVCMKATSISR